MFWSSYAYCSPLLLYSRFKRSKILEACAQGKDDRKTIIGVMNAASGLERYDRGILAKYHPNVLDELSRDNIRQVMENDLFPRDTSGRAHKSTLYTSGECSHSASWAAIMLTYLSPRRISSSTTLLVLMTLPKWLHSYAWNVAQGLGWWYSNGSRGEKRKGGIIYVSMVQKEEEEDIVISSKRV